MDINRVKRTPGAISYGVSTVSAGNGGNTGGSFREQMGNQLKDGYRKRIADILDEMASLSGSMMVRVNIQGFERYIIQLRTLLNEIVKNAYVLDSEHILDLTGRQRIFSSVGVVDQKLDELARDVLSQNGDKLDFLSKVDEIRGLVMDMLL